MNADPLPIFLISDRIMVLDDGRLAEFDTPARLRGKPDSLFAQLCANAASLG